MDLEDISPVAVSDPFALLMNPADVLRAVERSERLARLHSRICRPLDKQLAQGRAGRWAAEFDDQVDALPDEDAPTR